VREGALRSADSLNRKVLLPQHLQDPLSPQGTEKSRRLQLHPDLKNNNKKNTKNTINRSQHYATMRHNRQTELHQLFIPPRPRRQPCLVRFHPLGLEFPSIQFSIAKYRRPPTLRQIAIVPSNTRHQRRRAERMWRPRRRLLRRGRNRVGCVFRRLGSRSAREPLLVCGRLQSAFFVRKLRGYWARVELKGLWLGMSRGRDGLGREFLFSHGFGVDVGHAGGVQLGLLTRSQSSCVASLVAVGLDVLVGRIRGSFGLPSSAPDEKDDSEEEQGRKGCRTHRNSRYCRGREWCPRTRGWSQGRCTRGSGALAAREVGVLGQLGGLGRREVPWAPHQLHSRSLRNGFFQGSGGGCRKNVNCLSRGNPRFASRDKLLERFFSDRSRYERGSDGACSNGGSADIITSACTAQMVH